MTKRGYIQVRVSEGDKAAIEAAAGAAGLSVSEWLRRVCLRAAGEGLPLQSSAGYREAVGAVPVAEDVRDPAVWPVVVQEAAAERFVVPVSCPAPSKKTFRPDFK